MLVGKSGLIRSNHIIVDKIMCALCGHLAHPAQCMSTPHLTHYTSKSRKKKRMSLVAQVSNYKHQDHGQRPPGMHTLLSE